MTLPIERARTKRPVTWLTIIGVLLLPVIIGGVLVAALYNPVERLEGLGAAIVNDDEPVTIDGQMVPLGRQLTAGLVDGSDELDSNLTWTISNTDDAAAGLADGTYAAVITIPEDFSAAATSTAPGGTPTRATIEVQTPPDSLIVDDAITAQVTSAAASLMGQQVSQLYLENVFLGFTTLGTQLGDAADGAASLADGAAQAADGAAALPGGIAQLGDGAAQLGTGASALQDGLGRLAGGARQAADGASQLAAGVDAGAAQLEADGIVPSILVDNTDAAAAQTADAARQMGGVAQTLGGLAATCFETYGEVALCTDLAAAGGAAGTAAQTAGTAAVSAGTSKAVMDQFTVQAPAQIAGQLRTIGSGVAALGGGMSQVAGGIDQSAAGAGQLASGATQLADGASQAATGATTLADGIRQLSDGSGTLADGLSTAVDALPTYTDAEASTLADVVADPIGTSGASETQLFGASAIPLLAMLALWFGGLGTFVALQAVSRRALASRAPSALLALRALWPAAALGALQGLLVAGVVQLAASYDGGAWSVFAALAMVAGVAFATVNQSLVAVFGGAGRWISAVIGVLAVATGVVSTVPGALSGIASIMPTSPAYNGMVAALTTASGVGAAFAGLIVWSLLAFIATTVAVVRRRTVSARALTAASAPA